ncbi:hypothetical protein [Salinactinospora qingdaonensis]|uniref:PE family protein n=1 Tax=Salinactinospora qingdaonensis TaxID=702744 RepID=A0ABP7F2Y1_9ACTN
MKITIPADELASLKSELNEIHDILDEVDDYPDSPAACTVGPPRFQEAAEEFDDAWGDGQDQLQRNIEAVRDGITTILDSFEKLEDDLASQLQGDGSQGGSGGRPGQAG